jgi:ABC-2 type transport system ATP-binding protein
VLLTTQYLEEADRLAERMAVIDHGKVIAEGTSRDLKASIGANALRLRLADAAQRPAALELVERVIGAGVVTAKGAAEATDAEEIVARIERTEQAAMLLTALGDGKIGVAQFSVGDPSLDEVFLALTGHPAEETASKEVKP